MGNIIIGSKSKDSPRSKESIREENELIILFAAEKVFAKHGLKGSTTKQIADMAELPKSNIHYYFHTKLIKFLLRIQISNSQCNQLLVVF